jgi:hypothetical protein
LSGAYGTRFLLFFERGQAHSTIYRCAAGSAAEYTIPLLQDHIYELHMFLYTFDHSHLHFKLHHCVKHGYRCKFSNAYVATLNHSTMAYPLTIMTYTHGVLATFYNIRSNYDDHGTLQVPQHCSCCSTPSPHLFSQLYKVPRSNV